MSPLKKRLVLPPNDLEIEAKPNIDFIIFPIDYSSHSENIFALKLDEKTEKLYFRPWNLPAEFALFHEIIHTRQSKRSLSPTSIIEKRNPTSDSDVVDIPYYSGPLSGIWKKLYSNDYEYDAMYGFDINGMGLNLVNESVYLATKYNLIRASHGFYDISGILMFERLDKYVDADLYHFYLDSESPIRKLLPRFGIGAYACSDLDPETGEKLDIDSETLAAKSDEMSSMEGDINSTPSPNLQVFFTL